MGYFLSFSLFQYYDGVGGKQMDVWDDISQQDDNDNEDDEASAGSKNWESWRRQVDFSIYVPFMEGIVGGCEVQRCKVASLTIRMRIVCISFILILVVAVVLLTSSGMSATNPGSPTKLSW
jgi:hypothetical protein